MTAAPATAELTTVTGRIERLFAVRQEWSSGVVRRTDGSTFKFAGAGAQIGEIVSLIGEWVDDPKFGRQFKSISIAIDIELDHDGMIRWLTQNPELSGIGAGRATVLVAKYGNELEPLLEADEDGLRAIQKATRIPLDTLKLLTELWRERQGAARASAELAAFGLSYKQTQRLLKKLGIRAVTMLRENPYMLADLVPRFTFKQVDELARRVHGIDECDPRRLDAGIRAHLKTETFKKGSTWVEYEEFISSANAYLAFNRLDGKARLQASLENMVDRGSIDILVDECGERVTLPQFALAERRIEEWLRLAGQLPGHWKLEAACSELHSINGQIAGLVLSDSQFDAVALAASSRCSAIAGCAGTGKTSAIAYLVAIAKARGLSVELAALAGKAAKRLTERVGQDVEARTIHRLLGMVPEIGFTFNRQKPLDADVVIIDESSMIDVYLLDSLLLACDPARTSVVFLGDPFQLPPIDPGAPFRDLLAYKLVPTARLSIVHRSGHELAEAAAAILDGRVISQIPAAANSQTQIPVWSHVSGLDTSSDVVEMITRIYTDRLPAFPEIDPVRDVQILTPQRRGPMGTESLNRLIQAIVQTNRKNPDFLSLDESARRSRRFFTGDKVLQTKNNYGLEIFNGETGEVLAANGEKVVIRFENDVTIELALDSDEFDQVDLAYAMTVHKAQGSEYRMVLAIAHTDHYISLQRELLYTAVTRASHHLLLLGNGRGAHMAAKRPTASHRRTLLGQCIDLVRRDAAVTQASPQEPPTFTSNDTF